MELSFIITGDGSKTIYNAAVGENYHSHHGALQESTHVFLNAGLKHYLNISNNSQVNILEVGLGTGLNFLLTADYCTRHKINLAYTGIEAYPLSTEMVSKTGYNGYVSANVWAGFQNCYPSSLNHMVQVNNYCKLKTAHIKLTGFESAELYDIVYFDAFATQQQPEMWSETAITHTIKFLKPGGVFVTYAITGNLKRTLKTAGFKVEKVAGAPGKREMMRATKLF